MNYILSVACFYVMFIVGLDAASNSTTEGTEYLSTIKGDVILQNENTTSPFTNVTSEATPSDDVNDTTQDDGSSRTLYLGAIVAVTFVILLVIMGIGTAYVCGKIVPPCTDQLPFLHRRGPYVTLPDSHVDALIPASA